MISAGWFRGGDHLLQIEATANTEPFETIGAKVGNGATPAESRPGPIQAALSREARQGTYVMHFADSGEAALERLSGNIKPGLIAVLADINMPGMDGLQLLSAIKQRCPDLPVRRVTAYDDDDRRCWLSQLGATQFLRKPVDSDLLKEQLRRLSATERAQDCRMRIRP